MGVGLRERKKAQTREALHDAALELFNRKGFEQTTVEDIAEACDVSPRTFFRYFPTKEDVLFADAEAHRSRLLAAMTALPADANPFRAVLSGCLAVAAGYGAQRERLVLRRRVLSTSVQLRASSAERQRGWEDDVVQLLARRAEARGGPPEFELRLVTATALAALRVALDEWVAGDAGRDLQQLVEDAFRRVGDGLDPDREPRAADRHES